MYMVATKEWYDLVLCIKTSEDKLSESIFVHTKTNFVCYSYDLMNFSMWTSCHSVNVESIVTFTPYTSKHFQCSSFSRGVDCLLNDSDHKFHQSKQGLWYILSRKCPKWLNWDFQVAVQLIHFCRPICRRYSAFKEIHTWWLKCTGTCHAWR